MVPRKFQIIKIFFIGLTCQGSHGNVKKKIEIHGGTTWYHGGKGPTVAGGSRVGGGPTDHESFK